MLSTIENSASETFFQIFEYIDVFDLFSAFSGLNSLFNALLHSSTNLHLNFTHNCNYRILPISLNVNCLILLKLSNTFLFSIENFLRHFPLESFEQLRSFTLIRLRIIDIIDNIVKLKYLSSLILYLDDHNYTGHKIFERVCNGPLSSMLKRLELHQSSINRKPVKVRCQHGLSIEHLCYNSCFYYNNNFIQLLSFIPLIKSITIGPLWIQQNDGNILLAIDFQIISTSIQTLLYLNLVLSSAEFSQLEAFLSKYTPNLKYLSIKTTDFNFVNSEK
ncbi:unnamed protein product [Didymodactylos carnosus]|uniref:F-box domain-containing protein n=1 Tax=Didymodactylos carnosus TaxID=1234261 RepID=A0A8S2ET52_9BILA|nr:unnamed protein product [Didymodactylos carnosus]CAF4041283.1 unnamed protein product [Didymodactylos carnosus]